MVSANVARAIGDPNFSAAESVYAWVVTYNHLEHKAVTITGPHNATHDQIKTLAGAKKLVGKAPDLTKPGGRSEVVTKFRLYDDDGELYFSGYFLGDSESEDGFGPLNDYGEQSGCTYIQYERDGKWETL